MAIQVIAPTDDQPFGEVCYFGHVTDAQVAESVFQLLGFAAETGTWSVLTDCHHMVWTPSLADVTAAVEVIAAQVAPAYREALVLPSDVGARVSATHYITAATNRGLTVMGFATRDEAAAWLTGPA